MEFREYLKIIKKYKKIFFFTWGIILLLPLFTLFVQPAVYEGEQTILILRDNANNETKSSKDYDYYYRLESDKELAKTLENFLEDKALLKNVFMGNAQILKGKIITISIPKEEQKWISSHLRGEVLSSGYIKITILSHSKRTVKYVSKQLTRQLKNKISKIGTDQNRRIKLDVEPIIVERKSKIYLPVTLGTFFGGLLVSIFTVLSIHYLKEEE